MIEEAYKIKLYPREGLQIIKPIEEIRSFNRENGIELEEDNSHDGLWIEYSFFNGIKNGLEGHELYSYVSIILRLVAGVTPSFSNHEKRDIKIEEKCIALIKLLRSTYFSSNLLETRVVSKYIINLYKNKNKISLNLSNEQLSKIQSLNGDTLEEKLSNFLDSN